MSQYVIKGVNGPVVTVVGGQGLAMMDMVHVGNEGLIGEVVGVNGGVTTVQVYEDTAGLAPGQPVTATGAPMSVKLGPGLLSNIFDGIARPLNVIEEKAGPFITRGINISALDEEKLDARLVRELSENANKDMQNVAGALVPRLMIPVVLELSGIPPERAHDVTKGERRRLLEEMDDEQLSAEVLEGAGLSADTLLELMRGEDGFSLPASFSAAPRGKIRCPAPATARLQRALCAPAVPRPAAYCRRSAFRGQNCPAARNLLRQRGVSKATGILPPQNVPTRRGAGNL